MNNLVRKIELERKKLMDLCNEKGCVSHPDVLACSENLDRLIIKFLIEEKNRRENVAGK
ncbi:MAG: aspartyl-phosphate phosphatase Spo0E family protein [Clostridia bacterium]|nr:aspartyl-phosphate phosphatase Spo0E family protein [Clostridia bacterium]